MKIERTITIPVTRRQETPGRTAEGGYTMSTRSVPDGIKAGTVTITIDVDALMRTLGAKALGSKGGKAVTNNGIIKAVVDKQSVRRYPQQD